MADANALQPIQDQGQHAHIYIYLADNLKCTCSQVCVYFTVYYGTVTVTVMSGSGVRAFVCPPRLSSPWTFPPPRKKWNPGQAPQVKRISDRTSTS